MNKSVIALVDCNNFFVSCERLFRPDLEKRPVVVLSSNDGCVVSRSNEAKALGIPMGAPAFKYKEIFRSQGIVQFSANFELYGDISQRITKTLAKIIPLIEVYSVDESFLDLSSLNLTDYRSWATKVRNKVLNDVGVPVAIGVSRSKTLSKMAAERSKKDTPDNTILDLIDRPDVLIDCLKKTPIQDVWGVGRRLSPKLKAIGVQTALDLSKLDSRYAGQLMGIHGKQMIAELNEQNCHPIKLSRDIRQSIMHGRMFGEDTNRLNVIEAAIMSLTTKAAAQLRRERLVATSATVVLRTNRHKPNYKYLYKTINFNSPTADTGLIGSNLVEAMANSMAPNLWIHKADVLLNNLIPEDRVQLDLINNILQEETNRPPSVYKAFDSINERYGKSTIRLAAEDLSNNWNPKKKLISPGYTTNWKGLPVIT